MLGHLYHLGFVFRDVPQSLRDRVSCLSDLKDCVCAERGTGWDGRLILSTCERWEIYVSSRCSRLSDLRCWIAEMLGVTPGDLYGCLTSTYGAGAARRLLRIASGLDSKILGEPQILGQVRNAYLYEAEKGMLDPTLSALARAAIHAGKRVRTETELNRTKRSIVSITTANVQAIQRKDRSRNRAGGSILLIGTGQLAQQLAVALRRDTGMAIRMAGRDTTRTATIASAHFCTPVRYGQMATDVRRARIIVACTQSPDPVVTPLMIGPNRQHPLDIFDLAVPANVCATVASHDAVRLRTLDDLIGEEAAERGVIAQAESIVQEELDRFSRWCRRREVAGRITELVNNRTHGSSEDARTLHKRIEALAADVAA